MDKFGIFNLLGTALGSFNKKEETAEQKPDDVTLEKKATPPPVLNKTPLQAQMLHTMLSHDQFIKRVYNKQNKRDKN